MKIEVRSKSAAKEFVCDKPWAAISVVSEVGDHPELSQENRVDLLQLAFHDRSSEHWINHPLVGQFYFQPEQAVQVLEFMDRNWDNVECLLIHCEAGVSRSAAIAAAITLIKEGRGADQLYFSESTHYVPNMHVYRMILNKFIELGGEIEIEDKKPVEKIHDEPWDCTE